MSILKINDLQAAQTEGYISELTETEMTVCGGGSLVSIHDNYVANDFFYSERSQYQFQLIGGQLAASPVSVLSTDANNNNN